MLLEKVDLSSVTLGGQAWTRGIASLLPSINSMLEQILVDLRRCVHHIEQATWKPGTTLCKINGNWVILVDYQHLCPRTLGIRRICHAHIRDRA